MPDTIDVQAPDGSSVSFPVGTDDATIHAVMSQNFHPAVSGGTALKEGYLDTAGFGFRDEVKGLSEASGLPSWLGGFRAPVGAARVGYEFFTGEPGSAKQTYEQARDEARQLQKAAQEQHPQAFLAGQVGGAVVSPSLGAAKGATVGARMLNAARAGAVTGGLYGVGSGETPTERAVGGVVGAGIGGAVGGLASPVADVAAFGVQKGLQGGRSIYNTLRNDADTEAARRITTAIARDREAGSGFAWDPQTAAVADQAGIQRGIADLGGETTMALARSAANQSPEGRAALTDLANERFAGQAQRDATFIRDLVGGPDATTLQEQLEARARAANKPAYARAYQAGDQGLWSPQLEQLAGSPAVGDAMRSAAVTGKDRAIAEGFGAFNPPVTITQDGRVVFNRGPTGVPTYPNLQFWDYTYRGLRDRADAAFRAGRNNEGSAIKTLAGQMRDELDQLVPEFQQARSGAAQAFGAQDALEAGQKFVSARGQNSDYARVVAGMNKPEKLLFGRGFASELADRLLELRDNQNVINQAFLTSPASRQRIQMALGSDKAAQLEAYLRAETLADRLHQALGNSTTARQLAEMGLGGLGAGILGEGVLSGDIGKGHLITAGLALGGAFAKHRYGVIEKTVAQRIGQMLASDDPAVLKKGIAAVARSQRLMGALRNAGDVISSVLKPGGATRAVTPQLTTPAAYGARSLIAVPADEGQPNPNPGAPGR